MEQLSFFSAQARQPRVADLAGLLCGPGQAVAFGRGTAARLSVVLREHWRVRCLADACAERGVAAQTGRSEEQHPVVRTAFRADLADLAARWLRGAKTVPREYVPDGAVLRMWALTAGEMDRSGFRFGLDPHAADTHDRLAAALTASGLPVQRLGARAGGPALRLTGKRRLARLVELIGAPPPEAPAGVWPTPVTATRQRGAHRPRSAGNAAAGSVGAVDRDVGSSFLGASTSWGLLADDGSPAIASGGVALVSDEP